MNIRQISDRAYKYIFRNPDIFRQLLHYFVDEDFARNIKVDQLEPVDKEFISEEFIRRESDIVYKIRYPGKEVFVFVLLEFQSSRQRRFPVRMLNYISQFYDIYSRDNPGKTLPNVFPLLLYSGKETWDIPSSVQKQIAKDIPENYIPKMDYYPVIIRDIPEQRLLEMHSTVSAMMYLEQSGSKDEFIEHVGKLTDILVNENIINKKQFGKWANMLFRPENELDVTDDDTLYLIKGEYPMLVEMGQLFKAEGRTEGKAEGILEEKQQILILLLKSKFNMTIELTEFIMSIENPILLDHALEKMLTAESPDEIINILKS
ncbi:MAG: Rpn family recombination-promoting nuclease/putative transposase [Spirochaetales bacterium]|nr:Rpn family recombination-promoting nuclease/putative transposase [Spirochaetales bacterium]